MFRVLGDWRDWTGDSACGDCAAAIPTSVRLPGATKRRKQSDKASVAILFMPSSREKEKTIHLTAEIKPPCGSRCVLCFTQVEIFNITPERRVEPALLTYLLAAQEFLTISARFFWYTERLKPVSPFVHQTHMPGQADDVCT